MNIETDLLQVRKAYRLLYDYQARILDLVSYCGSRMKFSYYGGYSQFSNSTPKNGKGALGLWSWDWLNMYCYQFKFKTQNLGESKLDLSIFIVSDDGFFNSSSSTKSRTDVDNFAPVEHSNTKLIFVLGYNGWDQLWGNGWDNTEFLCGDIDFKENGHTKMFRQIYSLSDFLDESTTMRTLMRFQEACLRNGITLEIAESSIQ